MYSSTVLARVIAIFALAFSIEVAGKVEPITLFELANRTEVIALVTVIAATETDRRDEQGGFQFEAILRVEELLKGVSPEITTVAYYPSISISPRFTPGERCIVSLANDSGRLIVVQGYSGKVPVVGTLVTPVGLIEEKPKQDLIGFLAKIRVIVRKSGGK
jgi:hypothetical protein